MDAQEDTTEAASGNMQGHPSHEVEPPEPPSNEALRCYKEGLIDLLRPGESVFDALRRLGNLQVNSLQITMATPHKEYLVMSYEVTQTPAVCTPDYHTCAAALRQRA